MTNATPVDSVTNDPVTHPQHYTSHPSGVECIEITRHMGFNTGNAMKYVWRADLKHADGGIEDLEKAEFYIKDEIAKRKKARDETSIKVTTNNQNIVFNVTANPASAEAIASDVLSKLKAGETLVG